MTKQHHNLSPIVKYLLMLIFDATLVILSLFAAFSMRLGEWYWLSTDIIWLISIAPFIALPVFIHFGLYRMVTRYMGFHAIWSMIQAVSLYALLWGSVVMLSGTAVSSVPRSVTIINWIVAILLVVGSRMLAHWWTSGSFLLHKKDYKKNKNSQIIIYGAGEAGMQLSGALNYSSRLQPVAFIDDDKSKHKQQLNGLRVYAPEDLPFLLNKFFIDEILLAIPSASHKRKKEIITQLESCTVRVRTLPSVAEIAQGIVKVNHLREISIDDLLSRDSVAPDRKLLFANIKNKTVMVTGAGGSIGSELCRQIIQLQAKQIILFEQNEHTLYQIERELLAKTTLKIIPILGNVTHQEKIEQICRHFNVQTIYHAAAYKHVPMVEKNTIEGVKNNIFGTLHCARAAAKAQVETFVLISTDKAVRPSNTMGATKRFAEMILQSLAQQEDIVTRFTMVRFGNVLGSSGSVVPLFQEQIHHGGPVTVTDPEIIRYFMTIPEAAQLVIQAGAMGTGGDVFVLDMGEPVRILDLAKRMIHLSGLSIKDKNNPNGDIEILFTGLRPGEKLYEELLIGNNVSTTQHKLILRAEEEVLGWNKINRLLVAMSQASYHEDSIAIRQLLLEGVAGFKPQCEVIDILQEHNNSTSNNRKTTVISVSQSIH